MTTILGIKGKDPKTEQSYVVLAGDTQFNVKNGKLHIARKLVTPADARYAFAFCGGALNAAFFHALKSKEEIPPELEEFARHYNRITRYSRDGERFGVSSKQEEMFQNTMIADLKFGNACEIATLNRLSGWSNTYLFGANDEGEVDLFYVDGDGSSTEVNHKADGSGGAYASKVLHDELGLEELSAPIEDMIEIAMVALEAGNRELHSGGKDLAIVKPEGTFLYRKMIEEREREFTKGLIAEIKDHAKNYRGSNE